MGNSISKQVADLFQFALILCAAVVILVPIYWIASGAFKQQELTGSLPMKWEEAVDSVLQRLQDKSQDERY